MYSLFSYYCLLMEGLWATACNPFSIAAMEAAIMALCKCFDCGKYYEAEGWHKSIIPACPFCLLEIDKQAIHEQEVLMESNAEDFEAEEAWDALSEAARERDEHKGYWYTNENGERVHTWDYEESIGE